jgi:hypothetical protein
MDGVGLSRLARARYPQIKLILTSGQAPQQYARDSADVFIPKPYDMAMVLREVEALLAQSGPERDDA